MSDYDGKPDFPRMTTHLGCTMQVVPASDYNGTIPGVRTLRLSMEQVGDGRYVEVRLDPSERKWLAEMLTEGWIS